MAHDQLVQSQMLRKDDEQVLSLAINAFFHNQMWASVSELADSVPSTQSHKREVGTIMLWLHARV